jgi:hypothetical protein
MEEEMRARRVGNGPEFRLLQDEQETGQGDTTAVSFRGFATREAAGVADGADQQFRPNYSAAV